MPFNSPADAAQLLEALVAGFSAVSAEAALRSATCITAHWLSLPAPQKDRCLALVPCVDGAQLSVRQLQFSAFELFKHLYSKCCLSEGVHDASSADADWLSSPPEDRQVFESMTAAVLDALTSKLHRTSRQLSPCEIDCCLEAFTTCTGQPLLPALLAAIRSCYLPANKERQATQHLIHTVPNTGAACDAQAPVPALDEARAHSNRLAIQSSTQHMPIVAEPLAASAPPTSQQVARVTAVAAAAGCADSSLTSSKLHREKTSRKRRREAIELAALGQVNHIITETAATAHTNSCAALQLQKQLAIAQQPQTDFPASGSQPIMGGQAATPAQVLNEKHHKKKKRRKQHACSEGLYTADEHTASCIHSKDIRQTQSVACAQAMDESRICSGQQNCTATAHIGSSAPVNRHGGHSKCEVLVDLRGQSGVHCVTNAEVKDKTRKSIKHDKVGKPQAMANDLDNVAADPSTQPSLLRPQQLHKTVTMSAQRPKADHATGVQCNSAKRLESSQARNAAAKTVKAAVIKQGDMLAKGSAPGPTPDLGTHEKQVTSAANHAVHVDSDVLVCVLTCDGYLLPYPRDQLPPPSQCLHVYA